MRRLAALVLAVLLVSSLVTPLAGIAAADDELQFGDARAELDIREEHWIEDDRSSAIDVDRTDTRTIYDVRGPRYEVALENVDHEAVTGFGVTDGEATVEYDETRDVWVVEPEGEGTIALYWFVEEPVADGGDGETETTRYAASLQVSAIDWVHQTAAEHDELQQDAANWSQVAQQAREINPDQDPAKTISEEFTYVQFFSSPLGSLERDIQATLVMLTLRPGGLLILGTFILVSAAGAAAGLRYRHRTRQQLGEFDDIETERDQAWLDKLRRIIQQYELHDLYPDHIARAMHQHFGPNTWQAHKNFELMQSPTHVKGLMLSLMTQVGYVGVVERDENGDILELRAVHRSQLDTEDPTPGPEAVMRRDLQTANAPKLTGDQRSTDGGDRELVEFETFRYDNRADRELIDALPGRDLDFRVFEDSIDIDIDRVSLPIDNHDIGDAEFIQATNPRFPEDFEDEQQYAKALSELLQFVVDHPLYTDEEGNVREEMDLLSYLAEVNSVLADKADFPVAETQRKILVWIAEDLDPNSKLRDEINDLQTEGVGDSSSDQESEQSTVIDETDIGIDGSSLATDGGGMQ
jgi:hypothetical protein